MMKHLRYAKYLLTHKFWVMWYCFQQGLFWQGIIHDWDKLIPWKWSAYANYFCRDKKRVKKEGHFQRVRDIEPEHKAFKGAWESHFTMQPHHWQHWISTNGKLAPMPSGFLLEMICDWKAASMAQGKGSDLKPWYKVNYDNIKLHPATQLAVDNIILFGYDGWKYDAMMSRYRRDFK